jgi:hypothetical protein
MRKEQVICDVCGKLKQDTNHWFVITVIDNGDKMRSVILTTGSERNNTESIDLCGESCVLKKVSELISK